jgi:hypothetical protein
MSPDGVTVVRPGRPGSAALAALADLDEPVRHGDVLLDGLLVGTCRTDTEIANGGFLTAPPAKHQLVIGHASSIASPADLHRAASHPAIWCRIARRPAADR